MKTDPLKVRLKNTRTFGSAIRIHRIAVNRVICCMMKKRDDDQRTCAVTHLTVFSAENHYHQSESKPRLYHAEKICDALGILMIDFFGTAVFGSIEHETH